MTADDGLRGDHSVTPALRVENLSLTLGDHVIFENIDFQIEEGEIAVLIGPNGAGKTMLLRAILGLMPTDSGKITILGQDVDHPGDFRDRIGYLPQRLQFDRTFPITVFEVLLLRFKHAGFWLNRRTRKESIADALSQVRAEHLMESPIGRLSGGELQRVLLAYALLQGPDLLFLDEPAAGVDVTGEDTFYEIIHGLQHQRRLTAIMVSHDLDVVYRHADQVLCLNRELLCRGTPAEVLKPETLEQTYGTLHASYRHRH